MEQQGFFVVLRDGDRGMAPTVRHALQADAIAEAERLARANHGYRFYVLRAVSVTEAMVTTVGVTNLK